MTSVDEALGLIAATVSPLASEEVETSSAVQRVLSAAVHTVHPLPMFDQSAVDGYAVRHRDLTGRRTVLRVGSTVAATAQSKAPRLAEGEAARIFTGAMVPVGADTIVRQEMTLRDGESVVIEGHVVPGTDLRRQGEELPRGAEVAAANTLVTPGLIGALAVAGARRVAVRRQPRVHVLVTGDEVVPGGGVLGLGQIPDSNGPLIRAHLQRWGVTPVVVGHVADDAAAVRDALDHALSDADLVITSGGVSVGDLDFIPTMAEAVGARRVLWKVAQRPGGPLYVAERDGSLLLGLPGNPAAVLVNLCVHVRHALDLALGLDPARRWHRGRLSEDLHGMADRTFWLRATARTDDDGVVRLDPLGGQGSHMLSNLARADALVRVPPTSERCGDCFWWTPIND